MSTSRISVVAQVKAKQGKEEALRSALLAMVGPSRLDVGCLSYDLHESPEAPGQFMFYENWESKELLDSHLKQPHLTAFFARLPELVDGAPELTIWKKLS